jgi:hypothetical protein
MAPRAIDRESCSPLVDDACTPTYIDMTLFIREVDQNLFNNFLGRSQLV